MGKKQNDLGNTLLPLRNVLNADRSAKLGPGKDNQELYSAILLKGRVLYVTKSVCMTRCEIGNSFSLQLLQSQFQKDVKFSTVSALRFSRAKKINANSDIMEVRT